MNPSPYSSKDKSQWEKITNDLIMDHPLHEEKIVDIILTAWDNIFSSTMGNQKIGVTIFPKPQIIGALLHELIPAEIATSFPGEWRGELTPYDKDIVHIKNDFYSIELKTSSNPNKIFGNRSYAQKPTTSKKGKDGFYLAVNFEKFSKENPRPQISVIRFGWLDHSDWIGQTSPTGQQAHLAPETYSLKFKTLYIKR